MANHFIAYCVKPGFFIFTEMPKYQTGFAYYLKLGGEKKTLVKHDSDITWTNILLYIKMNIFHNWIELDHDGRFSFFYIKYILIDLLSLGNSSRYYN